MQPTTSHLTEQDYLESQSFKGDKLLYRILWIHKGQFVDPFSKRIYHQKVKGTDIEGHQVIPKYFLLTGEHF